jgi:transcriptional regulator with XRE-family HTH domain
MTKEEIKLAREALKLSQGAMAGRLCVSRVTYIHWESGKTKKLPPDLANVSRGTAIESVAVGEQLVHVIPATYPQFYEKFRKGGWKALPSHPLGGSGYVKKKYIDAYEAGDLATWQRYLDERTAELEAHRAADAAKERQYREAALARELAGQYTTSGLDDLQLEAHEKLSTAK